MPNLTLQQRGLADEHGQICSLCDCHKTWDNFQRNGSLSTGYMRQCKECRKGYVGDWRSNNPDKMKIQNDRSNKKKSESGRNRKWRLMKYYGLTPEQYDTMVLDQNETCPICKKEFDGNGVVPVVDHCHETKVVRGILCRKCNAAIGLLGDSPDTLREALKYLEPS